MNQFIVHSSLDIVEEVQWAGGQMCVLYLDQLPLCPTHSESQFLRAGARHGMIHEEPDLHYPPLTSPNNVAAARYLKHIDRFHNNYISAFITPSNTKLLLLYNPDTSLSSTPLPSSLSSAAASSTPGLSRTSTLAASARSSPYAGAAAASFNPTAPAIEDAMRAFFADVFDAWVKTSMNPFYRLNMPIRSPVFRARVAAAAKKYL